MCVKTNARNIQYHKMEMLYLKMRWSIWLLHTQEWSWWVFCFIEHSLCFYC